MSYTTGTDQLLCEIDDGVATFTLNRPEKKNALSNELTPALRQGLLDLELREDVRCIVITGAGSAFCSGGDVSGMGSGARQSEAPPPTQADRVRSLQYGQNTLTLRMQQLEKPLVAALPGAAAGAGFSIALACDLRVAAESAFLVTAFRNIGVSGDYGGSWNLTQLVGVARAKELYFLSERIGAEEARQLGLVNRVFPDETFREEAAAFARRIAHGPTSAIRFMKKNINRAANTDLATILDLEAEHMIRAFQTDDAREAIKAFQEKRTPQFKGR
ncbi:MAG: enoyl-CoA hydratase [Pseudomonadales bacterium]|jgi:enoyl-CoA hydratase/carnithine racemase|nr:enoyl-CoA hydratase [Pseudomonadales bacterium]MDP6471217.1 enoyl-CoA hydratase [Pseudomonadales bacterium]MDP6825594.1 enoyl-CoA hydratase [Pseudomonadales bacterium]MDP6972961.1 enoyl-CoA hydratase [Pseudomonadales bacterium]